MALLCFFLKGSVRYNFQVSWTYAGFGRSASAGQPVVLQTLGVPLHPSHELIESSYVLDLGRVSMPLKCDDKHHNVDTSQSGIRYGSEKGDVKLSQFWHTLFFVGSSAELRMLDGTESREEGDLIQGDTFGYRILNVLDTTVRECPSLNCKLTKHLL